MDHMRTDSSDEGLALPSPEPDGYYRDPAQGSDDQIGVAAEMLPGRTGSCAPRPQMVPRLHGLGGLRRADLLAGGRRSETISVVDSAPGGAEDPTTATSTTCGTPVCAADASKLRPVMVPRLSAGVRGASRGARPQPVACQRVVLADPPEKMLSPPEPPSPSAVGAAGREASPGEVPDVLFPWPPPASESWASELKHQMQAMERRLTQLHNGLGKSMHTKLAECAEEWRECKQMLHGLAGTEDKQASEGTELAAATVVRKGEAPALVGAVSELKDVVSELRVLKAQGRLALPTVGHIDTVASAQAPSALASDAASSYYPSQQWQEPRQELTIRRRSAQPWEHDGFADGNAISEPSSEEMARALWEGPQQGCCCRIYLLLQHSFNRFLGVPDTSSRFARFATSRIFTRLSMLMTIANCIAIAIDADMSTGDTFLWAESGVRTDESAVRGHFNLANQIFILWLTFEIVVHMFVERASFLFGQDWVWNLIDLLILISMLATAAGAGMNGSYARALRLARVSRALRAVRFIQHFESLQRMVTAVFSVALSLFWMGCLLLVTFYIVGIAMMEGVSTFLEAELESRPPADIQAAGSTGAMFSDVYARGELVPLLQGYYGGIFRTWVTLFRAISGGDWSTFAGPLAATGWAWTIVWLLYIFLALFGLLNVLIGVIVDIVRKPLPGDRAMRLAAEHNEELELAATLVDHMRKLGRDADDELSAKMLKHILSLPSMIKAMPEYGVDPEHVEDVVSLVGFDTYGSLSATTVARRLLSLRGEARSRDVVRVLLQLRRMREDQADMLEMVNETAAFINKAFNSQGEVAML